MFRASDILNLVEEALDAILRQNLGQVEYFQASLERISPVETDTLNGGYVTTGAGIRIKYRGVSFLMLVKFTPRTAQEKLDGGCLAMGDPKIYENDPNEETMRDIIRERISSSLVMELFTFFDRARGES